MKGMNMETVRKTLQGWKTYIVGIIAILTAIVAWSGGEIEIGTLIQTVFGAIMGMTVRAGVQKVQDATEAE